MCHKLLGGDGGSLVAGPLIVFVAAQLGIPFIKKEKKKKKKKTVAIG